MGSSPDTWPSDDDLRRLQRHASVPPKDAELSVSDRVKIAVDDARELREHQRWREFAWLLFIAPAVLLPANLASGAAALHIGALMRCFVYALGSTLALLGGCAPAAPAPIAPTQLHAARTPTEVVQVATRELVAQGFEVSVSDAGAGTVVARRVRSPDAQGDAITCRYARGSIAGNSAEATMTVNVSARTVENGSEVIVTSVVRSDFSKLPGMFAQQASNDTDCVSSGVLEKRIADALR